MSMPMVTKYKDAATLSFFRVAFGILVLYSMLRYVAKGWVDSVYIQPIFHFKYSIGTPTITKLTFTGLTTYIFVWAVFSNYLRGHSCRLI